jgi:hypothetical protein
MEKFNRAVRRHHVARLKHKRQYYWGYGTRGHSGCALDEPPGPPERMDEKVLGKVVQTPQMCSCLGCGNQRHNTAGWEPTLQERRWFQQYREQVGEAQDDLSDADADQQHR